MYTNTTTDINVIITTKKGDRIKIGTFRTYGDAKISVSEMKKVLKEIDNFEIFSTTIDTIICE